MDAKQVASICKALGNEHRVLILRQLVDKSLSCTDPEQCDFSEYCCDVGELAQTVNISPPTLSYHLKELRHNELVTMERDGRHLYYAANIHLLDKVFAFLRDVPQDTPTQAQTIQS